MDNYISHEKVPHALKNLIIWYKNKANTTDHVEAAYKLFWEFLKIHPFEDGNGRIARLLITYHLQRSGTPFPVIISSGKSRPRTRKHYYDAIKSENLINFSEKNDLYTLISYLLYLGWKNFLSNIKSLEMQLSVNGMDRGAPIVLVQPRPIKGEISHQKYLHVCHLLG